MQIMKPSYLGIIESGSAGAVFLVDLTFVLKANEQSFYGASINGRAIIDHEAPRERRFVAVEK